MDMRYVCLLFDFVNFLVELVAQIDFSFLPPALECLDHLAQTRQQNNAHIAKDHIKQQKVNMLEFKDIYVLFLSRGVCY